MTLTKAIFPTDSLLAKLALVLAGSALVAGAAQVSVPMFPVPMTLQTLAISLVGLAYGARLGAATLLAYLAEGAMGLPVFAGGAGGAAHLMGPTGGFLVGFVGMAWLTGWMAEHGFGRGLPRLFLAALVPGMLLFVPGVLWLWALLPMDAGTALAKGATPFLLGGVVKAGVAALIVSGAWQAMTARRG